MGKYFHFKLFPAQLNVLSLLILKQQYLTFDDRSCHYLRKFHAWYLQGRDVPADEVQALMEDPTLDDALDRLRAIRAAA